MVTAAASAVSFQPSASGGGAAARKATLALTQLPISPTMYVLTVVWAWACCDPELSVPQPIDTPHRAPSRGSSATIPSGARTFGFDIISLLVACGTDRRGPRKRRDRESARGLKGRLILIMKVKIVFIDRRSRCQRRNPGQPPGARGRTWISGAPAPDKRPPRQRFHKAMRPGIRPPTSIKRSEATAASGFESRARSADGSHSEMNRAHNSGQLLSVVQGDVAIQSGATNLRERTDHGGH